MGFRLCEIDLLIPTEGGQEWIVAELQNAKQGEGFGKNTLVNGRRAGFQSEYCRRNDLKLHSFLYWRKRQRTSRECTGALIEWPGQEGNVFCFGPALSLVINNHYRIEIHKGFDPAVLDGVIRVVMRL